MCLKRGREEGYDDSAEPSKKVRKGPGPFTKRDVGIQVGPFMLKNVNDTTDFWTIKHGGKRWHVTIWKKSGDMHVKGQSGTAKGFTKGWIRDQFILRRVGSQKHASDDDVRIGNMVWDMACEHLSKKYWVKNGPVLSDQTLLKLSRENA